MRANQPMGLTAPARDLTDGLVRVESGHFYEGYWDERYPLSAYVAMTPALAALAAARDAAAAALEAATSALEAAAREALTARAHAYEEYEQAVLYSSGPCMFLALRDATGEPVAASLWSECAMEAAAEGACACGGELCAPACPEDCAARAAGEQGSEEDWIEEGEAQR